MANPRRDNSVRIALNPPGSRYSRLSVDLCETAVRLCV